MTRVHRVNTALTILVVALSLVLHMLFLIFFSIGRTTAGANYPVSSFFEVYSVFIEDTIYGMDPVMEVDRRVKKPFPGTWTTSISTTDGEWICGNTGAHPYNPNTSFLPNPTHLFDFWLFIDRSTPGQYCRENFYPLPIGCYVVDTVWEVHDDRIKPPRLVSNRSNEFCVIEEPVSIPAQN